MKILTIIHDFRGGGAEKVAVLLANEWQAKGCESEIICISESGPFRTRVNPAVRVQCLNKAHAYAGILPLCALLRNNRDAVVISHLTHMNAVCLLAGVLAQHRRLFVVEHNDFVKARSDITSLVTRGGHAAGPVLYNFAQRVICVSQSVSDSLPALLLGKGERVCVVPNPLDLAEFRDAPSKADLHLWFCESAPVLVACGRLTRQKNYDMMLHALCDVVRRTPVKLLILGEGPDRERLVALAESLGVAESVEFVGFRKDPAAYFGKARLFVSTSAWEGLPMTMIEALFSGADMVVTNSCSDAAKLVNGGSFGVCVNSGEPSIFADAIIEQLSKPVAGVREKRRYLDNYSLPKIAAQYEALFRVSVGALEAPQVTV